MTITMNLKLHQLSTREYSADPTGFAARFVTGRWHDFGDRCIYTCLRRSQCLIEFSRGGYHFDQELHDMVFTIFDVPGGSLREYAESELPPEWRTWPRPEAARAFGSRILKAADTLVVSFPSAVFPDERIYLINPRHDLIRSVRIMGVENLDTSLYI